MLSQHTIDRVRALNSPQQAQAPQNVELPKVIRPTIEISLCKRTPTGQLHATDRVPTIKTTINNADWAAKQAEREVLKYVPVKNKQAAAAALDLFYNGPSENID